MFSLQLILSRIRGSWSVEGADPADSDLAITKLRPISDADEESLVFIDKGRSGKAELARRTGARAVICDEELRGIAVPGKILIIVGEPKLVFAALGNELFVTRPSWGRHPSAVIDSEAQVHPKTYIGPNCVLSRCSIAEGSVLWGNTYVHDDVHIGRNVSIQANCTIGGAGFGYVRDAVGVPVPFPQVGGVRIEDEVEIGANTCIDRGALGDTVIKRGAKVDNLVHIAHNAVIGRYAFVIAHAMVGGSAEVSDYAWVAPCAALKDQIKVGERAVVGMSASVVRDVPAGEIWVGIPAEPLAELRAWRLKVRQT